MSSHVIEQGRRLSQSLLWRLQREFFARRGVAAWGDGIVPHYVTCNPYFADAYARIVFGWLRDCVRRDDGPLEPSRPLHVVELGAGSGRFAFMFLSSLLRTHARSVLRDRPIRYVMTDFAAGTIDAWRQHPRLAPFVEAGVLDFARFDAEHDRELALERAGVTLTPDAPCGPIAVIANYFFDSIPQDVFAVRDGRLHECLVTLSSPRPEPDLDDPELLARLELAYDERACDGEPYDDPVANAILSRYRERLPATSLLFPCAALRCIDRLEAIAGGRMLLLSADKGPIREDELLEQPPPGLVRHGSFSLTVDHHAIGLRFLRRGGAVLLPPRSSGLNVVAFVAGPPADGARETIEAHAQAVERAGPGEFYEVRRALRRRWSDLGLDEILAFLRLSGWDPALLIDASAALMRLVDDATEPQLDELYRTIDRTWESYFPIGEPHDLAFYLGALLYAAGSVERALAYFERSRRGHGETGHICFHIGLCLFRLRRFEAALEWVERSLVLDPTEAAKGLRVKIASALGAA